MPFMRRLICLVFDSPKAVVIGKLWRRYASYRIREALLLRYVWQSCKVARRSGSSVSAISLSDSGSIRQTEDSSLQIVQS